MANSYVYLNYTGTRRYWTVPSTVKSATISYDISGGGGGGGGWDSPYGGSSGDAADRVTGTIDVKSGDLIEVGVGQGGTRGTAGTWIAGGAKGLSLTGFNGGTGGHSGGGGWSGSGGGGGGATVIKVNGKIVAVAGGGGGGGGGGHYSAGRSTNASYNGYTYGGNGGDMYGDGGGGGGGGGGYPAGDGGTSAEGDVGGYRGRTGKSLGKSITANGGASGGSAAYGSSTDGSAGYANLTLNLSARDIHVKREVPYRLFGRTVYTQRYWARVKQVFVKVPSSGEADGTWRAVKDIWVKISGTWRKTFFRGSYPVVFESSSSGWGGDYIVQLTTNVTSVDEGGSFSATLTTSSSPDGTPFKYTLTGLQAADFAPDSPSGQSGEFSVTSNTATKTWKIVADTLTEGEETATITVETGLAYPATLTASVTVNDTSVTPSSGGGGGCCVVATALNTSGAWDKKQKFELMKWCEEKLHGNWLGETFRRGYQVLGSIAVRKLIRAGGWRTAYATWSFNNGTRMVRGKSFNPLSIPNSVAWIIAFLTVGMCVSQKYATKCWKKLYTNEE